RRAVADGEHRVGRARDAMGRRLRSPPLPVFYVPGVDAPRSPLSPYTPLFRSADVDVCMLADGVALRNRCPQGQADPRAAIAGGASGVTMARAGDDGSGRDVYVPHVSPASMSPASMRWADVDVCMLADGVALRNRCPQGQADPRAAIAGGASGVTMVRAGPHPRRARSMRWADVYTGRDRRRRVGRDDGSGRPAPSARQVDAMGRRLRSPRLPGVDVPGVDGDGPTSTSPAWARRLRPAGPMAERWLSLSDENSGRPPRPPATASCTKRRSSAWSATHKARGFGCRGERRSGSDVRDESASVCLGGAGRQCIEAVLPLATDEVRVDVRVPIRPTRQCRGKSLYTDGCGRGSGRCSGLSVVRGRLRGLSWGNRPHFGADQPRRGARCDGPTSTSACWPTVLPSGIVALRGRLTHGPRSPAARRASACWPTVLPSGIVALRGIWLRWLSLSPVGGDEQRVGLAPHSPPPRRPALWPATRL